VGGGGGVEGVGPLQASGVEVWAVHSQQHPELQLRGEREDMVSVCKGRE